MSQDIDVSIVIISYNTRVILKKCIFSIIKWTIGINYEIFVVDNASTDKSAEMVASYFPQVTLIKNNKNKGFAKANNQVFRQSSGKYFLLINPDVFLKDNIVDKMVHFMDAYPKIAALGCKLVGSDGRSHLPTNKFPSIITEFLLKCRTLLANHSELFHKYWEKQACISKTVDWVTGALLMARSRAYRDVQGMDENHFLYFEDIDICKRFQARGWKTYYRGDLEAVHIQGAAARTKLPEEILQYYRTSQLHYYKKHLPFQFLILQTYLWLKGKRSKKKDLLPH